MAKGLERRSKSGVEWRSFLFGAWAGCGEVGQRKHDSRCHCSYSIPDLGVGWESVEVLWAITFFCEGV